MVAEQPQHHEHRMNEANSVLKTKHTYVTLPGRSMCTHTHTQTHTWSVSHTLTALNI